MADLVITAANVLAGANVSKTTGAAGVAISAGQTVYFDSTANNYKLADNNSVTAAARTPLGVALNNAAAGQPVVVQISGPITIDATLTAGVVYYQSGTPGAICPVADLVTGMYPTALGIATSTTVLQLNIEASGVAL